MSRVIFWGMCLLSGLLLVGCSEATKALDKAKDATGAAAKATEALGILAGGEELLAKVTDFFGSAAKTLQGITDVDSAKAASRNSKS